jgi:hypothetical protein
LPDELPVQWAQRAAPIGAPAEEAASDAAPQEAAGEEPPVKRRSRRPRRREEQPALETAALETVGAESAAPAQVLERPKAEPASAPSVEVIEVGGEETGADGDQQRKRGWWRRLIESLKLSIAQRKTPGGSRAFFSSGPAIQARM